VFFQLVELMGGRIDLESRPGNGTTATCEIPFPVYDGPISGALTATTLPRRARLSNKSEEPKEQRPAPTSTANSKQSGTSTLSTCTEPDPHILLVEDNPVNRKVISLAIKKLGFTVSVACDGQEALQYLCKQSTETTPHAIIMDCQMPNVDGYEATRRIREDHDMFDEKTRRLPIIALTASAIKGDREKCWDAGMDDYLTKPADRDALERTLVKWTNGTRPYELRHNPSCELR
jgi:CheY-like chemotaxis protein